MYGGRGGGALTATDGQFRSKINVNPKPKYFFN
jgi:hypothetical protein